MLLFLSTFEGAERLANAIHSHSHKWTKDEIRPKDVVHFDHIISYNYRHRIKPDVLRKADKLGVDIINCE